MHTPSVEIRSVERKRDVEDDRGDWERRATRRRSAQPYENLPPYAAGRVVLLMEELGVLIKQWQDRLTPLGWQAQDAARGPHGAVGV